MLLFPDGFTDDFISIQYVDAFPVAESYFLVADFSFELYFQIPAAF
jgi:hypothetical protein